jgi:hypothetical protein
VIAEVSPDELVDVRNRELVRVLQDPLLPDLDADQIVIGLDDDLADHAERCLELLANRPAGILGQVHREARQALDLVRRERFDYLKRQLEASIKAAQDADDLDSVDQLRQQFALLYARHKSFDPPPSPYFLDLRSGRATS